MVSKLTFNNSAPGTQILPSGSVNKLIFVNAESSRLVTRVRPRKPKIPAQSVKFVYLKQLVRQK